MPIKRKDDPELFEKYLNTLSRQEKKVQIAFLKLKREIAKVLYPYLKWLDPFYIIARWKHGNVDKIRKSNITFINMVGIVFIVQLVSLLESLINK